MLMGDFFTGDAYEGTAVELPNSTYIGSVDTFNEDVRGSRFICEGYLVDRDDKPRILPPRDTPRRGQSPEEPSSVLDLLLVDSTGPIRLSIWGSCVDQFLALMESVDTERILLRFDPMRKAFHSNNGGSGPPLTRIPVLHSIPATSNREGTAVSILQHPSSPYLKELTYVPPTTEVCITKFYPVRSQLSPPISRIFSGYGNGRSRSRRHPARIPGARV